MSYPLFKLRLCATVRAGNQLQSLTKKSIFPGKKNKSEVFKVGGEKRMKPLRVIMVSKGCVGNGG